MSAPPHPHPDRSRPSTLASSNSGRPLAHAHPSAARQASYSSLNEALGSSRRAHPAFPPSHPINPAAVPANAQMSSDGRYMYQQPPPPQGMTSYEYQSYPGAFHDPQAQPSPQHHQPQQQQVSQSHHFSRPTRTPSAQSHSPPLSAPFNPGGPSSTSYPQTQNQPYASPSYPAPSSTTTPGQAQWGAGAEVWSQYAQPYITPPAGQSQEAPGASGSHRPPEHAAASASNAQRAFNPSANAPTSSSSNEPHNHPHNQHLHRDSAVPLKTADPPAQAKLLHQHSQPLQPFLPQQQQPRPQQPSRKRSGKEPASRQTTPPAVVDYAKLADSYRQILDTTATGRLPPEDALERILQAAAHNFHTLRPAFGSSQPAVPAHVPAPSASVGAEVGPPGGAGGEEGEGGGRRGQGQQQQSLQQQQQAAEGPVPEGQTCLGCNATSTPEWRRGPLGPRTLCNACGLVYAKLLKKRNRDAARREGGAGGGAGGMGQVEDAGLGSSGDEDEEGYAGQ